MCQTETHKRVGNHALYATPPPPPPRPSFLRHHSPRRCQSKFPSYTLQGSTLAKINKKRLELLCNNGGVSYSNINKQHNRYVSTKEGILRGMELVVLVVTLLASYVEACRVSICEHEGGNCAANFILDSLSYISVRMSGGGTHYVLDMHQDERRVSSDRADDLFISKICQASFICSGPELCSRIPRYQRTVRFFLAAIICSSATPSEESPHFPMF